MKFLRHLAAAVLVVAVVVALAIGWEHLFAPTQSGAAGFVTNGAAPLRAEIARSNPRPIRFRAGPGAGFDLAEAGNLRHTVLIVAVIMGGVVAVDAVRRQQHRAQRRAALRATAAPRPDPARPQGDQEGSAAPPPESTQ